jgi:hypothetical protein
MVRMGKGRLPDMLLPIVRRRSSDLTAMFDGRRGCCEEEEESAASAQRKDRVEFICRSLTILVALVLLLLLSIDLMRLMSGSILL